MARRLDALLRGPYPRLPRPLDTLSEQWSRLRPRVRLLAVTLSVVAVLWVLDAHSRAVQERWGGAPATVLVSTKPLAVGQNPAGALRVVDVPPALVPPRAVTDVDDDAVLALALPEGSVLTAAHLAARGPAAGLAGGLRVVPVPAEAGWGVTPGGWVDVWTLGGGDAAASQVAAQRPVVSVREDAGGLTVLVGLAPSEVEDVTAALALGRVLLTHAPPPGG